MEGDLKGYLKGDLKGDFEVDLEVDLEGDFRGDFKQDLEGDLLSSLGQLRSRSGLVQVWFSIELKFNSFELDSEVGRLVFAVLGQILKHLISILKVQQVVLLQSQAQKN